MGDLVAHREYSAEGKIDPAGIDMPSFRSEAQKLIDQNAAGVAAPTPSGGDVNDNQDGMLREIHEQAGRFHPVRQVFQKVFYNIKDGKFWLRAGAADIWNEVVWDGFVNPVDLLDGKVDPDNAPQGTPAEKIARRGSLISYVLATYREASLSRRNTDEILKILKKEA
ncbi:hypothetical protein [Rhodococcoides fascians]|uniref:hypothetical protein n=1 Tax=Rhodococcoides fascians TaxID=1828 RepID=UPI00068A4879|nr:hypothetical protein [Rhodococcus fascians]